MNKLDYKNITLSQLRDHYLYQLAMPAVHYNKGFQPSPRVRTKMWKFWEKVPLSESCSFEGRKVWVTSDWHFGHHNIIKYSDRPFETADEMDSKMIYNFNNIVHPDDISIWVGDVSFRGARETHDLVNRCNGYKILIVGNHDIEKDGKIKPAASFNEVHLLMKYQVADINLIFTHYPIDELHEQWTNVHGHEHISSHSPYRDSNQHINVCCELHNYTPISLDLILNWVRDRRK